jgi:hypothetical protein
MFLTTTPSTQTSHSGTQTHEAAEEESDHETPAVYERAEDQLSVTLAPQQAPWQTPHSSIRITKDNIIEETVEPSFNPATGKVEPWTSLSPVGLHASDALTLTSPVAVLSLTGALLHDNVVLHLDSCGGVSVCSINAISSLQDKEALIDTSKAITLLSYSQQRARTLGAVTLAVRIPDARGFARDIHARFQLIDTHGPGPPTLIFSKSLLEVLGTTIWFNTLGRTTVWMDRLQCAPILHGRCQPSPATTTVAVTSPTVTASVFLAHACATAHGSWANFLAAASQLHTAVWEVGIAGPDPPPLASSLGIQAVGDLAIQLR